MSYDITARKKPVVAPDKRWLQNPSNQTIRQALWLSARRLDEALPEARLSDLSGNACVAVNVSEMYRQFGPEAFDSLILLLLENLRLETAPFVFLGVDALPRERRARLLAALSKLERERALREKGGVFTTQRKDWISTEIVFFDGQNPAVVNPAIGQSVLYSAGAEDGGLPDLRSNIRAAARLADFYARHTVKNTVSIPADANTLEGQELIASLEQSPVFNFMRSFTRAGMGLKASDFHRASIGIERSPTTLSLVSIRPLLRELTNRLVALGLLLRQASISA